MLPTRGYKNMLGTHPIYSDQGEAKQIKKMRRTNQNPEKLTQHTNAGKERQNRKRENVKQ